MALTVNSCIVNEGTVIFLSSLSKYISFFDVCDTYLRKMQQKIHENLMRSFDLEFKFMWCNNSLIKNTFSPTKVL